MGVAAGTGVHDVLVEALTKANLVTTLKGTGPFTVFAPTDDAFTAALTALGITKQQLLDRADLADILKYHVLAGKTESSALQASQTVATVNGLPVTITKDTDVMFASAKVTSADVACDNGVIHVINKVIIPPTVDLVATVLATGNHAVLAEALTKANLVTTLQGTGPFTVFAPTDDAFTAALSALSITKQQLLDRADLPAILKYHVLSGKTLSSALQASQTVPTVNGADVTITKNTEVMFADAKVTGADVLATNGVIHVINKVVLPPSGSATTTAKATTSGSGGSAITTSDASLSALTNSFTVLLAALAAISIWQ